VDFLVHYMVAAARGLPTLHTFDANRATLVTTLDELALANAAVTSGTQGAAPPPTKAAVSAEQQASNRCSPLSNTGRGG
jgi:hypothetical protein